MKLRHPTLIAAAAALAAGLVRLWLGTVRPRLALTGPERHPIDPRRQRYIYVFWHESLLLMTAWWRVKLFVLISHHADGELITRVCRRLGFGVVRGSTTRGGGPALLELVRRSR